MLFKTEFKGRNRTKIERHYEISVMGDDIKAYIVTVTPATRNQLGYLLTKKNEKVSSLEKDDHAECRYLEDVESSALKICIRSSGSR